jgi:hypothetical protein
MTEPPAYATVAGRSHFNTIISNSYFQLGLFFLLAALFGYFIFKLIVSINAVYTQYQLMKRRVENKKVAFKIPGVTVSSANAVDDDADYSDPLADRYDAGRMNYNDNIEEQLARLDDDVINPTTGLMKNTIKFRKDHVKDGDAPYIDNAYIGNNVLSADFDNYVYPDSKPGEKSFFEYLFTP